jgi:hypothetical protein
MILSNGTIRTLERSRPIVDELVVEDTTIRAQSPDAARQVRVDLGGRCVVPGFTDSHVHFPTWSIIRSWLDLEGCTSLEAALALVAAAAAETPPDRWLVGCGWAGDFLEATRYLPRQVLDGATGAVPTALWSKDMHTFWLNSEGIARVAGELDADGDTVEVDERGEPTGILREAAAWRFRERWLAFSVDEYAEAVIEAIGVAHSRGVTAIHDKDGWIGAPAIWERVRDRGELGLRVWQSVPPEQMTAHQAMHEAGAEGDFLRVGYLKVFVDGSLGSDTALMLGGGGVTTTSAEDLVSIIYEASAAGWPVAVHAIGDRANRIALDALEATSEAWRPRGLRQRVEHAQHLDPDDVPRFAALGVACSVQFTDAVLSRDAVDHLPPSLAAGSFAFRTLSDSGAVIVNGSDAPLTDLDPLLGIRAAVARTLDERGPWRPEQALTVVEALEASSVRPAWLCGEERNRGRLVPGQLADLAVLDRDPVACEPEDLASIRVVATMIDGRWVHNPPPWD